MAQTVDGEYISDEEIDRLGDFLEHQGFDDEGIDEYFLEHHGVKGMQWGVRKQRRIERQIRSQQRQVDRTRRVASGVGSIVDKATVASRTPLHNLLTEGLQGSAEEELRTAAQYQKDIKNGHRKVRALMLKLGGVHYMALNFKFKAPPAKV